MASKPNLTNDEVARLTAAVLDGLREREIDGTVELEESGLPGRYRLFVVSPDFDGLLEAERQEIIWRVLKERWPREHQLRITLSVGLSPAEAEGSLN